MKDDGRIPRIKDTDMTDRLLTAGAIAEDTRNPIGDIAACFPGHGSQSVGMFHARAGQRSPTCLGSVAISMRWDQPSHPIEARSKSVAGPSTPPIMGRCRDLRAGWRFSSVTAG